MNDMVTIPREEYEDLVEARDMLADTQAYDRAIAALADGADELIPAQFADRLIDGENHVRVYRELREMTQSALAQASGVSRVQITTIEAGTRSGSIATYKRLAEVLRVSVDDLI